MITFRKRALCASVPTIIGAAILATSLGVAETLSFEDDAPAKMSSATVVEDTPSTGKGDLKVELADVHSRPMRCVSGKGTTTCTGWPIAGGMLAYAE